MTTMNEILNGDCVVPGRGAAAMVRLDQPLSFWGGFDSEQGVIVEPTHPQCGVSLAGKVLVMEKAKGSSSSSSVLAEAIRNGTGPVAIVMRERDLIVALGCIVADELYGKVVPLATIDEAGWRAIAQAAQDATVEVDCLTSAQARISLS